MRCPYFVLVQSVFVFVARPSPVDLGGARTYVPGGIGSTQDVGAKSQWYTQYPSWSSGVATRGIGGHQMPWAVRDHRGRLLQG
jgi:hypothetical protein